VGQVDAVKTPATPGEVAGAMLRAYARVTGTGPTTETGYLMPLAQSAFETGHWKSMFNWNTGNVTSSGAGDWVYEYAGSLRFQAYASLDDGATSHVAFLKHCGALGAMDAGDVHGFVEALRACKYIGSDEASYQALEASLPSILAKYRGTLPLPPPAAAGSMLGALAKGAAIVGGAGLLAWVIREGPKRAWARARRLV